MVSDAVDGGASEPSRRDDSVFELPGDATGDDPAVWSWVARRAVEWAEGDALQRFIDTASGGPQRVRDVVAAFLSEHDPFPPGRMVEVEGRESDGSAPFGRWVPAVVVERASVGEWLVEYVDGLEQLHDWTELRPAGEDRDR